MRLEELPLSIEYISGKKTAIADALFRIAWPKFSITGAESETDFVLYISGAESFLSKVLHSLRYYTLSTLSSESD